MKNSAIIVNSSLALIPLFEDNRPNWSDIDVVNFIIREFYDSINKLPLDHILIQREIEFVAHFNNAAIQYNKSYRLTPI